jgi:hypothetical protein
MPSEVLSDRDAIRDREIDTRHSLTTLLAPSLIPFPIMSENITQQDNINQIVISPQDGQDLKTFKTPIKENTPGSGLYSLLELANKFNRPRDMVPRHGPMEIYSEYLNRKCSEPLVQKSGMPGAEVC